MIIFHDQHNHQETNNLLLVGIHHIQIILINQNITHEYPLFETLFVKLLLPQIFIGASSSSSIG